MRLLTVCVVPRSPRYGRLDADHLAIMQIITSLLNRTRYLVSAVLQSVAGLSTRTATPGSRICLCVGTACLAIPCCHCLSSSCLLSWHPPPSLLSLNETFAWNSPTSVSYNVTRVLLRPPPYGRIMQFGTPLLFETAFTCD